MAYIPTINDIRDITPLLSSKLGSDYTNYGFTFLKRRLTYLFNELNIRRLSQFIDGVNDGSLLDEIKYLFPVVCTELLRDPSFWRTVKDKIQKNLNQETLTFWFPELNSTEELFSLLIILDSLNVLDKVKITCNIDNFKRIEQVKEGYVDSKNRELNKSNLKRLDDRLNETDYFIENNGAIFLKEKLLQGVTLLEGNFMEIAPCINSIFMIIYRNKMLYYNGKLQKRIESELAKYLIPDCFLALGIRERISPDSTDFFLSNNEESIYKVIK